MRLPSLQQIWQETRRTTGRFPLVILNAAVGVLAAIVLIEQESLHTSPFVSILYAALLGIPLLTGTSLLLEKRNAGTGAKVGGHLLALALLIAYGCSAPTVMDGPALHVVRLLLLGVAMHLFVAVAPFTGSGEMNGFWQYNKTLLYRIITAVFYSGVLFVGFAVALAALDQLFGVTIPPKRYAELWLIMAGLFNTTFFLAGIPQDLSGLEHETDYPKSLKIFVQYILTPLVVIYLVILYAYVAKILISWSWPKGWVSKLILGYSATGILSLLLLYPVRELKEYKWVQTAWNWFFIVLIPLIIILPLAVWRRTSQYGLTEGRYLALALAACLALLSAYFIFSRAKNIKVIPGLLCVLALLASYGPWSVFTVSENSQINRLKKLLMANNILSEGKIRKADRSVSADDAVQISSIISYLHDMHGYGSIQPWFTESIDRDTTDFRRRSKFPADVVALLGIEYMQGRRIAEDDMIVLIGKSGGVIDIGGYERMLAGQFIPSGGIEHEVPEAGLSYAVSNDMDSVTINILQDATPSPGLHIDLQPLFEKLSTSYGNTNPENIPLEEMSICASAERLNVKLYVRRLRLQRQNHRLQAMNYTMDILYSPRNR